MSHYYLTLLLFIMGHYYPVHYVIVAINEIND